MRILVTGSRDWTDRAAIMRAIDAVLFEVGNRNEGVSTIVSGACPTGADALAEEVASALNMQVERHPADWTAHGKAAGFRRNAEMVALGADACLAFLGDCTSQTCRHPAPHFSHGTSDCMNRAINAGIYTKAIRP